MKTFITFLLIIVIATSCATRPPVAVVTPPEPIEVYPYYPYYGYYPYYPYSYHPYYPQVRVNVYRGGYSHGGGYRGRR